MSNSAASDTGVGRALLSTRIKLSVQAAFMCVWGGMLPGFLIPIALWGSFVTQSGFDVVKIHLEASVVSESSPRRWHMRDVDGVRKVITVKVEQGNEVQYLTPRQVLYVLRPMYGDFAEFVTVVWFAFASGLAGYYGVWYFLTRLGKRSQDHERLRGAFNIVTSTELTRIVRKGRVSRYTLVDVPLPIEAPMMGLIALGSQGSGKSLAIHDLMQQVFRKKRKCFIYDQNGEFFRAYYRPGKDFFFNPALLGSVPWSLFSELEYTYDSDTLAHAFLPQKGGVQAGANAFFEDAARSLFSVILLRLRQRGAVNTSDIAKAFLEMPDEEMDHLIKNSIASSAVGGDSKAQRQGVISSIAIYLNGIAAVAAGNWSIRDFLSRDDDARFFILGMDDTKAMFAPLYRLILNVSFSGIASKAEIVHEDKYWFFLDEVNTLGDIKLDDQLATLRKFGVCIVSGIQSESQVVATIGEQRATTVMNCFNTILQLKVNDPDMMERASLRLTEMEEKLVNQNTALAVTDWRDGAGLATQERNRRLVMPSEIGMLDPCTGFLKLSGSMPVAKVNYRNWLPKSPGARSRVDANKPQQGLPDRDPAFKIISQSGDETHDVFETVKAEMKAPAGEKDSGKKLFWNVTSLDAEGNPIVVPNEHVEDPSQVPRPTDTFERIL